MRVLIIYRTQSRPAIEPLAAFLRIEGFEVDLETAASGVRSVADAIPTADRVLVLWDGEAAEGGTLHASADYAGELGKLILLLSGVSEAPFDPRVPRFPMGAPAKSGEPPPYGEMTNLLRLKLDRIPATRTLVEHRQMSVGPPDDSLSQSINPRSAASRAPDESERVKEENANLKAELRRLQMDVKRAADTIQRLSNPEVAATGTAIGARFKPQAFSRSDPLRIAIKSPSVVGPGQSLLLQVWLFTKHQRLSVAKLAKQADSSATDRGTMPLGVEAARGSEVTVTVESGGLEATDTVERVVWQGVPVSAQFKLIVPDVALKTKYFPTIRVFLDGVPVTKHTIGVVSEPGVRIERAVRESRPRQYKRAFLSYAAPDRTKVLEQAQAMRAVGVEVFQDCLDLLPSERWEGRLYNQISKADLFLLFWSKDAAKSTWVRKEAEFALHCQRTRRRETPEIVPVILDGPPPAIPPASLSHIHFGDPIRCVIAAFDRT